MKKSNEIGGNKDIAQHNSVDIDTNISRPNKRKLMQTI